MLVPSSTPIQHPKRALRARAARSMEVVAGLLVLNLVNEGHHGLEVEVVHD